MKKIFKYFIPFILAAFLSSPAQAVTMNGCNTVVMQGCTSVTLIDFPASLVARLDATISASYLGAGDDWLDANGDSNYDFFLGRDGTTNGEEPAFSGIAGDSDATFQFDGGDRVTLKVNTAFITRIHKTDETSLGVTFHLAIYWPLYDPSGQHYLFGTSSGSTAHGFRVQYDRGFSRFRIEQTNNSGSTASTFIGTGINFVPGTFNFLIVSFQKTSGTAGTYRLKLNDTPVITGSLASFLTSTTNAATQFQWSGVSGVVEFPSGVKLKGAGIFNDSLSASQENNVRTLLETDYGNTFPKSTDSVRHFFWNSPSVLNAANVDQMDVTGENWFDNSQGFMVIRAKAPASFIDFDYQVVANDGTTANSVGFKVDSAGRPRMLTLASSSSKNQFEIPGYFINTGETYVHAFSWKAGETFHIGDGLIQTSTYTGDPVGMDTIDFAAQAGSANDTNQTFYDLFIGNTYKTAAELQSYMVQPNDVLVAGGGQSLMNNLFVSADTASNQGKMNLKTACQSALDTANLANKACLFVNGSTTSSGAAKTSASSNFWWDVALNLEGPALTTFKADMDAANFTPNILVWSQGEQDSTQIPSSTTKAQYKSALTSIFNEIRATYGAMPVVIQRIGRRTSFTNTGGIQTVRDVQTELAAENSWIYLGPDSYDQPLFDTVHLSDAGYETVGTRLGNFVMDALGYTVASAVGPSVTAASRSGTTVTVTITHDSGTDFTPTTGIEGFHFFDDASEISISAAVRTNATTITLTLASAPTGVETLYYIYDDEDPLTLANVVKDNATTSMPLQSTKLTLAFSLLDFGADLVAWYDATDASSITLNGSDVSQWNDLSSNGNHLAQATAADQPFYDTVNELVRFDGVSETIVTTAFSSALTQPVTIFSVYKVDAVSGTHPIYAGNSFGSNLSLETDSSNLFAAGTIIFTGPDTSLRIMEVTYNGGSAIAHRDGVSSGAKNTGSEGFIGLRVGAGVWGSPFLDGYVKEIFIIDRLLTTAEKNQVGNYLASKHSGTTWTDIP